MLYVLFSVFVSYILEFFVTDLKGATFYTCDVRAVVYARIKTYVWRVCEANLHIPVAHSAFRIRTEGDGGAWCPKDQVLKNGDEYLEIDLGILKVITLVETQGRFGNGQVFCIFVGST